MMRLTDHQRSVICRAACECFGASSRVRLFGSRTDDRARGGDIDLFIETDIQDTCEIARAEINFQVRVQEALGTHQIDLLIDYPGRSTHPRSLTWLSTPQSRCDTRANEATIWNSA